MVFRRFLLDAFIISRSKWQLSWDDRLLHEIFCMLKWLWLSIIAQMYYNRVQATLFLDAQIPLCGFCVKIGVQKGFTRIQHVASVKLMNCGIAIAN